MTRSISPKPLGTAQQVLGRAGKTASAAALARSASPRSASSVEWADHKKLKDIAKDLQRQLQRKEADASRLTDRVQKLIALRDEQLAESQAERRRLHYALEQEEVEVQRFRGRSCELQEALAAEVGMHKTSARTGLPPISYVFSDPATSQASAVKYVCDHKVIGRVRIKRVLNPSSWFDRSTYLRAETVAIEDEDPEEDCWQLEGQVMDLMRKLEPLYKDATGEGDAFRRSKSNRRHPLARTPGAVEVRVAPHARTADEVVSKLKVDAPSEEATQRSQ
eukprot:g20388.t1